MHWVIGRVSPGYLCDPLIKAHGYPGGWWSWRIGEGIEESRIRAGNENSSRSRRPPSRASASRTTSARPILSSQDGRCARARRPHRRRRQCRSRIEENRVRLNVLLGCRVFEA
jgi:hypothetical protein